MSSRETKPKEWSPFVGAIYGVREMGSAEVRYVGLTTKTVRRRRSEHFTNADRGIKTPFADWLRTYQSREDVFFGSLELVMSDDLEDLGAAEQRWIARLRADGHRLLNLTDGGLGPRDYVWSDEQRRAVGDRTRGTTHPNPLRGADNPMWGRTHTDEQKAIWSEARKGTNAGATNPNFGKSASEETRAKMSAARKERPMPSSVRSAHTRHHTNKGVFTETCRHCIEDQHRAESGENQS